MGLAHASPPLTHDGNTDRDDDYGEGDGETHQPPVGRPPTKGAKGKEQLAKTGIAGDRNDGDPWL